MTVLYQIQNLNFSYQLDGINFQALKGINLNIASQEMITFAGPSGSGKSTLLNLLGLMENSPTQSIFYNGKCLGSLKETEKNYMRRYEIGFIFQSFHLFPVLTTWENVEFFLIRQGLEQSERKLRVEEALGVLGIEDLKNKKPTQLSGGQRQRVAIARALAKKPKVIIADEPTASLDQKNGEAVVDYLFKINKQFNSTIIMASHDPMVLKHSPKTIHLLDGHISEGEL